MDLGATRLGAVWLVAVPALRPAIIASALLSFVLSFDDFITSFFTSGIGIPPLPVRIYGMLREGVTPEVNAVGVVMLVITAVAIALAALTARVLTRRTGVLGGAGSRSNCGRSSMPDGQPTVQLAGVTKIFGHRAAVDDITLDTRSGEFFSLLGPSGCGKTTTLRMLAGLIMPDSGRILLDGQDVTRTPSVPEGRQHRLPVLRTLRSPDRGRQRSVRAQAQEGTQAGDPPQGRRDARPCGPRRPFAEPAPSELSGGQRQRVALARSLVNMPKVLLLDEPLGALDLKLRRQMQVELKRIQREVGITFIYVTHDQEEALTMSDRIGVMNAGQLEQVDVPEGLYEQPATAFVAGFIGSSNLLTGTRVAEGIKLDAGLVVPVPHGRATALSPGEPVVISLRPENVDTGRAAFEPRCIPPRSGQRGSSTSVAATQYTDRLRARTAPHRHRTQRAREPREAARRGRRRNSLLVRRELRRLASLTDKGTRMSMIIGMDNHDIACSDRRNSA